MIIVRHFIERVAIELSHPLMLRIRMKDYAGNSLSPLLMRAPRNGGLAYFHTGMFPQCTELTL